MIDCKNIVCPPNFTDSKGRVHTYYCSQGECFSFYFDFNNMIVHDPLTFSYEIPNQKPTNPIPQPTPTIPPIPTSEPFTITAHPSGNGVIATFPTGNTQHLIASGGQIVSGGVMPKQG